MRRNLADYSSASQCDDRRIGKVGLVMEKDARGGVGDALLFREVLYAPCSYESVTRKGGVRRYYIYILRRLRIP